MTDIYCVQPIDISTDYIADYNTDYISKLLSTLDDLVHLVLSVKCSTAFFDYQLGRYW